MYHHVTKLMYTVNMGEPDPRFGRMLLEQFGVVDSEIEGGEDPSVDP
jgi:Mn-containing catalase